MELKIPQNYHIESEIHWEIGYIYHVKNSDNKEIMYILGGGRTNNAVAYDVDTLSRDFSINNKIDTTVELDGKKMRIKIVVLQSARYINNVLAPLSVEFQYSPDSGDSLICEKIISSAKTI
ncbi:MAG: hypothetical protein MJZ22_03695 [Candidatus Saccharibacteria bacterium]|nr:hypothetical protein [Candidatus Saccharibacteria bacterium]